MNLMGLFRSPQNELEKGGKPVPEEDAGIRTEIDLRNEKIGYKIRAAQQVDRVPYMLVLGAKEAEAGNLSVRDRKGETTTMEVDEFIAKVTEEIKTRSYNA